jgi:5-methylcytosine-specific restriction endonuclease McrA
MRKPPDISLPCKHGHTSGRSPRSGQCVDCRKTIAKRHYSQNSEAILAKNKKWQAENAERCAANNLAWQRKNPKRSAAWKAANSEKLRAQQAQWWIDNAHMKPVYGRTYRQRHPEKVAAKHRRWKEENPEQSRAIRRNRRARLLNAPGVHTSEDIGKILKLQKNRCAYCRASFDETPYQVDHVLAISRGGSNDATNIQLLCRPCNSSKWCKDPIDFARSIGRLI